MTLAVVLSTGSMTTRHRGLPSVVFSFFTHTDTGITKPVASMASTCKIIFKYDPNKILLSCKAKGHRNFLYPVKR